MTKTIAALLTLGGILSVSEANAQHIFRRGHARGTVAQSGRPQATAGGAASSAATPRVYPYSYYASRGLPARTYVGYGDNDFPFYGSPYGHPYDAWTFSTLSGSYGQGLARYYDPPVK